MLSKQMPIIYSPQFLQHETGLFHPEKPARLTAIVKALQQVPWRDRFDWQLPTPVTARNLIPLLEKIHSPAYLQELQTIASQGGGYLDADTPVSARSYDVALLAVSAWLDGVDLVIANQIPVFALTRPPGHHATKTRGMGFCLLSNAAIAATYALQQANINKVAILDWDVHHGNGTQEIVESNRQIAYCSLHQFPFYPGTGSSEEKGIFNNVLNLPLPAGSTYADYESKFINDVIPFITDFQPDILIISAGYDANYSDPLGNMCLFPPDYGKFTQYIQQVTSKILFGLEGGYELNALADSVVATIEACLTVLD